MDAATAGIVGAAVGGLIASVSSLAVVAFQTRYQRARDQAERLVAHRREFAASLSQALGELIALAIRAVPERPREAEELSLDSDTWPVDWKSRRGEQDRLRDTINQLALLSPYWSTVECARTVVERLDEFAKAESMYEQTYEGWLVQASDEEREDWQRAYHSAIQALTETRKGFLDAAYRLRRHLEFLISRPESDPGHG